MLVLERLLVDFNLGQAVVPATRMECHDDVFISLNWLFHGFCVMRVPRGMVDKEL